MPSYSCDNLAILADFPLPVPCILSIPCRSFPVSPYSATVENSLSVSKFDVLRTRTSYSVLASYPNSNERFFIQFNPKVLFFTA